MPLRAASAGAEGDQAGDPGYGSMREPAYGVDVVAELQLIRLNLEAMGEQLERIRVAYNAHTHQGGALVPGAAEQVAIQVTVT